MSWQELPPWFWERQNMTRRPPGDDVVLARDVCVATSRSIYLCRALRCFKYVRTIKYCQSWVRVAFYVPQHDGNFACFSTWFAQVLTCSAWTDLMRYFAATPPWLWKGMACAQPQGPDQRYTTQKSCRPARLQDLQWWLADAVCRRRSKSGFKDPMLSIKQLAQKWWRGLDRWKRNWSGWPVACGGQVKYVWRGLTKHCLNFHQDRTGSNRRPQEYTAHGLKVCENSLILNCPSCQSSTWCFVTVDFLIFLSDQGQVDLVCM